MKNKKDIIIENKYYKIKGKHEFDYFEEGIKNTITFETNLKNELEAFIETVELSYDGNSIYYINSNKEKIKINDNLLVRRSDFEENKIEKIILVSKRDKIFLKDITFHYKKNKIFYNNKNNKNIYKLVFETEKNLNKIVNILIYKKRYNPI